MTSDVAPDAFSRERLESYFRAAAFVLLLLLGGIAAFRAYFALESAILVWLRPQYVSLAQAGFSLLILGLVVWLIRAWVIARRA
ncbi:MAG TPA: hypothetical protein VNX21_01475 [Candidatus Thermoplasmatota archaeon]|nr:hypothetical protein [Candidatus Thermoplasmatota archaeon]